MTSLPDRARELLDAHSFVTLATLNADGSPQATILWAARDGDTVLLSTLQGRQKERNLQRDPRVSLVIHDAENPYTFVEVRGSVTITTDGGPELIQTLSQAYTGGPYTADGPDDVRVVLRLEADKVVVR
ncbi:PPOX class F420-dependent oxidoreductase [Nocardioides zeae]|uniref:PPOX class F420-dependent oxidoreductase n=1 Tax=Nocardioides imazamoxiresistens TaxID=3231893 RepID=A0ABU3Q174_9ACTN|nr:PPOX class F420-dependent oxidoreductase [Nocardioides zeae]MDT9595271.1 PPOX class F420-dependent oxidoreductase [Nocardioides zeae]